MVRRSRLFGVSAMLGVPAVVLVVLRLIPRLDAEFFSAEFHLIVISVISGLATVIAIIATVAARSSRHPGVAYLSIGGLGVGVFMMGHGLTTPGIAGQVNNPWVGRFPYLALGVFSVGLFAGGLRVNRPILRFVGRFPLWVVSVAGTTMGVATAIVVNNTALLPAASWEENLRDVIAASIIVLSLYVVLVHWRRWLLGNDVVQLALCFAAAMTIAATVSLEHGVFRQLSWWDYHAYLLAGFGSVVFAILHRAAKSRTVTDVLSSAFDDDVFVHIAGGYPEALRQLVKAVEVRDSYTHGHSERTARVATELAINLGLPEDRLRVIARGAFLHDLGKIGIPDSVLNKPSKLTPEERAIIETHPRLGYEMARGADSLREALDVILYHHERFDGSGYPAGLTGTKIPLEARVVAVADVWDALTTDRAYRPGWEPHKALAHIVAASGTHFDPSVVAAMTSLAAEWGIRSDRAEGNPAAVQEAAERCHQSEPDQDLVGV